MSAPDRSIWSQKRDEAVAGVRRGWHVLRTRGPSQFQFWLIALVIGIAAGFAALFFRKGITLLQGWAYGTDDMRLVHSAAADLPWWWLLAVPACGGLIVGLILHFFTPDARARSVADVIEGAALQEGRAAAAVGCDHPGVFRGPLGHPARDGADGRSRPVGGGGG